MEKNFKPNKKQYTKYKVKKRSNHKHQHVQKFQCLLCEKIIVNPDVVRRRKNYPFGKKSKAQITYEHREDGGVLVELNKEKRKRRKNDIPSETTSDRNN